MDNEITESSRPDLSTSNDATLEMRPTISPSVRR